MPSTSNKMANKNPSSGPQKGPLHALYSSTVTKLVDYLGGQPPPGPAFIQARLVINAQKCGTLPFMLGLMTYFDNWSSTAQTYAALHGSYGIIWYLKDQFFRDGKFDKYLTPVSFVNTALFLVAYWVAPVLVVAKRLEVSDSRKAICVFFYALGVVLMSVADAHKYFALKYNLEKARKKQFLIQDGFFWNNRNPNYLGEMMLYGSFAGLVPSKIPWAILAFVWGVVFTGNMYGKEDSLMKKPGWDRYARRSWLFLPKPGFLSDPKDWEADDQLQTK